MRDECDLLCLDLAVAETIRLGLPEAEEAAPVTDRMRALGDSQRFRLAHALSAGSELCVCDLAWIVGSSQGLVSHHLRQLRGVGLVQNRRDGKLVMYRLSDVGRTMMGLLGIATVAVRAEGVDGVAVGSHPGSVVDRG